MKKIIVLGAGMVGSAIAADLSEKFDVTCADINQDALNHLAEKYKIKTVCNDLSKQSVITDIVRGFDLVVSAVPGFMGFHAVKKIIEAHVDCVDISFMPEDTMELSALAKKNNVTVICDCGVAPGMPNFIVGYHNEKMSISSMEYMVGGLPKERKFPFQYKAPFSPVDVIEEYMRPARYVENGYIITKPPMSDPELVHFENVGDLEAFNTDGLRSLIYVMKNIPNMKEKTLRYPGHIQLIQALKASGFFDKNVIDIKGKHIVPLDFTCKILFNEWKLKPVDREFTVMRIILKGEKNGKNLTLQYDLFDEYDEITKFSSMARTTGYTATAAANLILEKMFNQKGVFPPELVGKYENCFHFILDYLSKRNVIYKLNQISS